MTRLHDDFWNFRGDFKIAKIINLGTHISLVRRTNGRFVVLDSYDLDDKDRADLLALTDGGSQVDAIINVHPFHTLHCAALHRILPAARLIGTRRHLSKAPELPWEQAVIEDPETQREFAEDFEFSVPLGVDFVSSDDSVHVASVLVRHRASGIVHVDDTINVLEPPGILRPILPEPRLRFHPMLSKALETRKGAADDYARWAQEIARDWAGTRTVCTAHSAVRHLEPGGWQAEITHALSDVEKTLDSHRAEYG